MFFAAVFSHASIGVVSPECLPEEGGSVRALNTPAPIVDVLGPAVAHASEAVDAWNVVEAEHKAAFAVSYVRSERHDPHAPRVASD